MPRNDNSFFREPLDGELSDDLDGGGFDDNFGNSGDFNDIGLDDGLARSRPGTATSVLFQVLCGISFFYFIKSTKTRTWFQKY